MGGGKSYRDDVRRAVPVDLIQASRSLAQTASAAGALADATQFCSRSQVARFSISNGTALTTLMLVRLELRDGRLAVVLSNTSDAVGVIDDDSAEALAGCLHIGYAMEGHIERLDADAGSGEVLVSGRRNETN
jgi:hypothetical protein